MTFRLARTSTAFRIQFSFQKDKFGFAELGQCILQHIKTFVRQEIQSRLSKTKKFNPGGRELNPGPHSYIIVRQCLKKQNVHPWEVDSGTSRSLGRWITCLDYRHFASTEGEKFKSLIYCTF